MTERLEYYGDPTTLPTRLLMGKEPPDKKKDYPCGLCGRVFGSQQALGNHITRTHKKKSTNRRASSNGRRKGKEKAQSENLENHIHYLFGRIERDLENYSVINGVPVKALAEGVAGLLRR